MRSAPEPTPTQRAVVRHAAGSATSTTASEHRQVDEPFQDVALREAHPVTPPTHSNAPSATTPTTMPMP